MEPEKITRPPHYVIKDGVEVVDVREWWMEQAEAWLEADYAYLSHVDRAIECLLRAPSKNGMEDVRKAYQYLHRAVHGEWPND